MCRRLAAELGGDVYFHYRPERAARRLRLASYGGIDADAAQVLEGLNYGAAVCGTVAATQQSWVIRGLGIGLSLPRLELQAQPAAP